MCNSNSVSRIGLLGETECGGTGTLLVPSFSTRMRTYGFWMKTSSSENRRPQNESILTPARTCSAKKSGSAPFGSFPWITSPLSVARMASH
jgi:hypothetical protein